MTHLFFSIIVMLVTHSSHNSCIHSAESYSIRKQKKLCWCQLTYNNDTVRHNANNLRQCAEVYSST